MKYLLVLSLLFASVQSAYINNAEKYSLIKKRKEFYLYLVKDAYKNKAYTYKELEFALKNDSHLPLSDVLRLIAFDEMKNIKKVIKHAKYIQNNSKLLKKYPPMALAVADILLRLGQYNKVEKILPREDVVLLKKDEKIRAYYYIGLSKYLRDGTVGSAFKMSMNHYEVTKNIYYKKGDSQ